MSLASMAGRVLGLALTAILCLPQPAVAISPLALSGGLAGTVRNVLGAPQMGAVVILYDRRDKPCERVLTNEDGRFSFGGLVPDFYSVRVTLASFLPAIRDQIQIQPGTRKLLDVNLSTLFSTIQLAAPDVNSGSLISDEWKWVIRSSSAQRPVLRILPALSASTRGGPLFSDTRAMVRLSGGDSGSGTAFSDDSDLGTAFAVSTSLRGATQFQFSGNLGYISGSGLPSSAFRATLSRTIFGGTPEIAVTMRQLFTPGLGGSTSSGPRLRTTALSFGDKVSISESLEMEYGFELDTVSYLEKLSYFSPYARMVYRFDDDANTRIDFAYTSGNARPELSQSGVTDGLERDLSALSRVPRLTLRDGHSKVQRGEDYEIGVSRTSGSRDYRFAAYRESVTDAALTVSVPGGAFAGDVIPDLFSNTSVFNAGDYHTIGYTASATQHISDRYNIALIYGSVGVLVPDQSGPISGNADDLRSLIRATRRTALTTQAAGTVPLSGTRFRASYQWTDYRSATSGHIYSTQPGHPEPGLNLYVQQPLPPVLGLPGHVELTGDFRNLLAQGYLPFSLTNGQRLLLMRTPRSFRGGLSISF